MCPEVKRDKYKTGRPSELFMYLACQCKAGNERPAVCVNWADEQRTSGEAGIEAT